MSEMLTCETSVILGKFAQLGVSSMVKVHKAAFASANRVLMKEARLQLSGVTARSKTGYSARRKGWTKESTLERGIRSKVDANGERGMVHIMGDFRLKWFEMGTEDRYRKGDAYTGRMRATRFFAHSVSTAKHAMEDAFTKTVARAVISRTK
jgi:hypothetical protein